MLCQGASGGQSDCSLRGPAAGSFVCAKGPGACSTLAILCALEEHRVLCGQKPKAVLTDKK